MQSSYSILPVSKKVNKDIFLKRAKVSAGAFAGKMFERIYRCLFTELINSKEEYEKYYKKEYESYHDFLQKRYDLNEKEIEEVKLWETDENIILYRRESDVSGDYGMERLMFSEEMYPQIEIILLNKKKENNNENTL